MRELFELDQALSQRITDLEEKKIQPMIVALANHKRQIKELQLKLKQANKMLREHEGKIRTLFDQDYPINDDRPGQ